MVRVAAVEQHHREVASLDVRRPSFAVLDVARVQAARAGLVNARVLEDVELDVRAGVVVDMEVGAGGRDGLLGHERRGICARGRAVEDGAKRERGGGGGEAMERRNQGDS